MRYPSSATTSASSSAITSVSTSASTLHQVFITVHPSPRPSSIEGPTDTEDSLLHFGASPFHVRISRDGTQKAHLTRPFGHPPPRRHWNGFPPIVRHFCTFGPLLAARPTFPPNKAALGRPSAFSFHLLERLGRPKLHRLWLGPGGNKPGRSGANLAAGITGPKLSDRSPFSFSYDPPHGSACLRPTLGWVSCSATCRAAARRHHHDYHGARK